MNYGIPYQGSKAKICNAVLNQLPAGKRFVDLFGGGFAMSEAAYYCDKWEEVYYNELNPLLPELISRAITGYYNYDNFIPEFISRDKFHELKDKDGYVKYVWSFSNDGEHYLYGRDIEQSKELLHNWIVFDKYDDRLEIPKHLIGLMQGDDIHERRIIFKKIKHLLDERSDVQHLERLQHLEHLERLQHLERLEQVQHLERLERLRHLERLELNTGSYLDYQYKDGDVVYCDPPYENTAIYSTQFDSHRFYDWAASRDYPVYFSSYKINDDRFKLIYCKLKTCLKSVNAKRKLMTECLYWNGVR